MVAGWQKHLLILSTLLESAIASVLVVDVDDQTGSLFAVWRMGVH